MTMACGVAARAAAGAGACEVNPLISAHIVRRAGVLVAAAIVTVAPAGVAPAGASASACAAWTGVQPPNPGTSFNELTGVAVLSACNAWAVGDYGSGSGANQTLIVHWNGAVWKQVASPNPAARNVLTGVAASSATNIWAVGFTFTPTTGVERSLIVHWNGAVWKRVASPNPSPAGNSLTGVAATSATSAWAVGGLLGPRVILHWNGTAWRSVKIPQHLNGFISGVAATSATSAWAVGGGQLGGPPFILHWNGTAWRRVAIPGPGPQSPVNILNGVAATSARNAWAVGFFSTTDAGPNHSLIWHWNGAAWKRVKSPDPHPFGSSVLNGVAATSARNAWAVGSFSGITDQTLIEHWNGTAWRLVASPDLSSTRDVLTGVAASSATNAWAVGSYDSGTVRQTLALHCC
jgi:hypothetical protein